MTTQTDTNRRPDWIEDHRYTNPIVRELPRPVGADPITASLW